jgi:hypothetical protein
MEKGHSFHLPAQENQQGQTGMVGNNGIPSRHMVEGKHHHMFDAILFGNVPEAW